MDHTGDDELKRLRALNERLRTQRSTERERADRGDDRIAELELMVRDLQAVVQKGLGPLTCEQVTRLLNHPADCAQCAELKRLRAEAGE